MPQQVIRPAAGLALRIHVGAPEKERLHVEMLQLQLTGLESSCESIDGWD